MKISTIILSEKKEDCSPDEITFIFVSLIAIIDSVDAVIAARFGRENNCLVWGIKNLARQGPTRLEVYWMAPNDSCVLGLEGLINQGDLSLNRPVTCKAHVRIYLTAEGKLQAIQGVDITSDEAVENIVNQLTGELHLSQVVYDRDEAARWVLNEINKGKAPA